MDQRERNVAILQDTLQILKDGQYEKEGKVITLPSSLEQRMECHVLLPEMIDELDVSHVVPHSGTCAYSVINTDTFSMTEDWVRNGYEKVLALNLANPVHPGGGVRRGARAQEEDLCRKSSLLPVLESESADSYYRYNWQLHTKMGSDAVIVTPYVDVFKDVHAQTMAEPFTTGVITAAAPLISYGLEGRSESEYKDMFRTRIRNLLKCAAYYGYRDLVLGAWGCGAFSNDARVVAPLFKEALQTLNVNGYGSEQLFAHIGFAILCGRDTYNYDTFKAEFGEEG
jgi:uncharacterized protein (TIGR02452 family)